MSSLHFSPAIWIASIEAETFVMLAINDTSSDRGSIRVNIEN